MASKEAVSEDFEALVYSKLQREHLAYQPRAWGRFSLVWRSILTF